ncbi:alpha/beta hydrolase family esterase [Gordonia araii]|uniref:alpha/beta hydrolase family esterase n=1 Tax=Gordonia araii TaxID=263909 RepID=UPI0002D64609|nr:PHB depolymerase family esterase [Gordonia araii]
MLSRRLALSAGVLATAGLIGGSAAQYVVAAPQVVASPAAACSGSANLAANSSVSRTLQVNGVERHFRVHLPSGYSRGSAAPLILAFHGRGEKAIWFERYTQLSRLPAIVAYPDGLRSSTGPRSWQSAPYANPKADDIAFTRAIIRKISSEACVDRSRIFAVGRSNGGGLVNLLACQLPGQFAGIAMVSGAFYPQSQRGCQHSRAVSRIEFHGTEDRIVPYDGAYKFGSNLPAVPAYLDRWTVRSGCQQPLERKIASNVTRIDWFVCRPLGTMVSHVRIDGGTHRWPGSTRSDWRPSDRVNAAALIWQFFQLQRPGLIVGS